MGMERLDNSAPSTGARSWGCGSRRHGSGERAAPHGLRARTRWSSGRRSASCARAAAARAPAAVRRLCPPPPRAGLGRHAVTAAPGHRPRPVRQARRQASIPRHAGQREAGAAGGPGARQGRAQDVSELVERAALAVRPAQDPQRADLLVEGRLAQLELLARLLRAGLGHHATFLHPNSNPSPTLATHVKRERAGCTGALLTRMHPGTASGRSDLQKCRRFPHNDASTRVLGHGGSRS